LADKEKRQKINSELWKMEFLARLLGAKWKAPYLNEHPGNNGAIGGYCGGKDIDECRKTFGEQLTAICASCPE